MESLNKGNISRSDKNLIELYNGETHFNYTKVNQDYQVKDPKLELELELGPGQERSRLPDCNSWESPQSLSWKFK